VLHVHHIRPHGTGGLTEIDNLITLCHTCHIGLDPHLELGLYGMLPGGLPLGDIDRNNHHYLEGVQRHRQLSARLAQVAAGSQTAQRQSALSS
jgi:HNH endonuclease